MSLFFAQIQKRGNSGSPTGGVQVSGTDQGPHARNGLFQLPEMPAPHISPHGRGVHIQSFGRSIQATPRPESFNIFPLLRGDAQEQRIMQAVDKIGG
jgi:hypothetical protein